MEEPGFWFIHRLLAVTKFFISNQIFSATIENNSTFLSEFYKLAVTQSGQHRRQLRSAILYEVAVRLIIFCDNSPGWRCQILMDDRYGRVRVHAPPPFSTVARRARPTCRIHSVRQIAVAACDRRRRSLYRLQNISRRAGGRILRGRVTSPGLVDLRFHSYRSVESEEFTDNSEEVTSRTRASSFAAPSHVRACRRRPGYR
jgi:hypothetical protein